VSVEKIFAEDVIEEVYDVSAMRSVKESWSASAVGPCVSAPGYAYSKTSILNKPPYKLSGGRKRLVALVAAVAHQPKLLLLDEPSTYLDAAVLVATHDAEFICRVADKSYVLTGGRLINSVPSFRQPLCICGEGRWSQAPGRV